MAVSQGRLGLALPEALEASRVRLLADCLVQAPWERPRRQVSPGANKGKQD